MYRIQQNSSLHENADIKFENNSKSGNFTGVDQLKQQLINYIYNIVDLSRFKFELLQYDTELPQLVERKYLVSVNFSGSSCLLVFTKIRDKYHSFLVERKTLSYNVNKVNINMVKIFNVHLKLDPEIYKGTIFDGIFIQGKNKKTFVITDVYVFKGQEMVDSQLESKMLTIHSYLKSNYNETDEDNTAILAVNRLYSIDETEHVINNVIPKMRDFSTRGICFYPEKSGTKLIFLFGNESRKDNTETNMIIQNGNNKHISQNTFSTNNASAKDDSSQDEKIKFCSPTTIKKITKTIYIPKQNTKPENYVFEMKKTETVDVYFLNIVETISKDSKNRLLRKKVGLAYIPNVSRSKWCSEIMENTDGNILVHCKFHPDKLKWEPTLLAASKRPSLVEDFDTKQIDE
jgi:hypothetical protein